MTTRLIKDVLQSLLSQSRTLHVLDSAKFPSEPFTLLRRNRPLLLPLQLLHHLGIVSQIYLRAHDKAWHPRAVMMNLREPLFLHIFEGRGGGDTEADEENICLRVG